MALIFCETLEDRNEWARLCAKAGLGFKWLVSGSANHWGSHTPPQIAGLEREVFINAAMITSVTSLVKEAAELKQIETIDYSSYFSAPELTVLEECLDFYYSIQIV